MKSTRPMTPGRAFDVEASRGDARVAKQEHGPVGGAGVELAEGLWRVRDVARFLAMTPKAVYAMTARGEIPVVRIGGRLRYAPHVIRKWLASLER